MIVQPTKILVIDDEDAHIEAIRRGLATTENAYHVSAVQTIKEFQEITVNVTPDIILADLNLPDGKAFDILKGNPSAHPWPILVMTAYGDEAIAVKAIKAGALDYIVKSETLFAELPRVINRALREWEHLQQRLKAERERYELERRMLHGQKLESLGVLAGGIAHDFNNILLAVLGHADLALQELPPLSPARENLQAIETAARQAAELCRQMLAYSGKGRFIIQKFPLDQLINEMVHLLRASISKKAILKLNLEKGLPTMEGDATQIRQVVMNLITNASEAIGEQNGVISITTGVTTCPAGGLANDEFETPLSPGNYVFIEVADTGCGMSEEVRSRIFDPFFTTKFTGRGLGMAAVLGIVRGHKGAIRISSEQGKGSTFRLLFPAIGHQEEPIPSQVQEKPAKEWRGEGLVLVVDDEETNRHLGTIMLQRLGFEVLTAIDGQHALDVFKQEVDRIRFVLLDLTMPRMDGEETLRELRKIAPQLPVILVSGYTRQDITARFAGKGLTRFIQKPFTLASLRAAFQNIGQPDEAGEIA